MGILLKSLGLQVFADQPAAPSGAQLRVPSRRDRLPLDLNRALALPAAFRSVQVISGKAAELEIDVWRNGRKIERPSLVAQPDPWRTLESWIERNVINLAGDGNTFWRIHRSADTDQIMSLEVLDPNRVQVYRDERWNKKYALHHLSGRVEHLNATEVKHLRLLEVPGTDRGVGPIGYCRLSLEGALDTRDYAAQVFRTGQISGGTLVTDQPIERAAMKEYQRIWRDHDPSDVRVMGRGLKHQPVAINPTDAQWLESQTFSVLDVARMFGMPAPYLEVGVEGDAMTYQNLKEVDKKFLRITLFPVYLRKIEAALTELLPRGQRARFDTSALLRPDEKDRMEIHGLAIEHGIYGPEYEQRAEGSEPEEAKPIQRKEKVA